MKWSKFPQEMQDFICKLRSKGVPASHVLVQVSEAFPNAPTISIGGIYHVERRRKGIHRESRHVHREKAIITLAGPSWSVPEQYRAANQQEAA
jgi:hypothetical protein